MARIKPGITVEDENLQKKIIHPVEKEDDLFKTLLPVHAPYQVSEYNGLPMIFSSRFLEIEDQINQEEPTVAEFKKLFKTSTFINPFTEDSLLEDIYNIDIGDNNSILTFCNKYGLYGLSVIRETPFPLLSSPLKMEGKEAVLINLSEGLEQFREETMIIQSIIKAYFQDIPSMEKTYQQTKDAEISKEIRDYKKGIGLIVNRGLRLVSPSLNLRDDTGEFFPSNTSVSLLGAAYYQIYEAMTNRKQYITCDFCGSLFVPRVHNSRFCPPTKGPASSCNGSYSSMRTKARKAYFSGEKSIEEIANSITRPINEVKGWMTNYKPKNNKNN